MGKIAPVSAKYIIHAKIDAEGVVEKPDVIGAVFGQTEGLLGSDLELRELQKSGRIGRIDANMETVEGKTKGNIEIPSSLNKEETAIIAAALETIQRIGPCEAKITIENIEDVRVVKRDYLMQRAKELLKKMIDKEMPDSQEITEDVKSSVMVMKVTTYGPEALTAGPDIDNSDEIIVVEGRADVLNLLHYGFTNVISLDGTSISNTIIELCKSKKATLFMDGDRGGDMILKEIMMRTNIAFIARAPSGKEVEELTGKEIHQCLRAKRPVTVEPSQDKREYERPSKREYERPRQYQRASSSETGKKFKALLNELMGTKGAYILDKNMNILGKVPVKELPSTIRDLDGVYTVIMDGPIVGALVKEAESLNITYLIGTSNKARSRKVKLFSANELG